MHKNLVKIPEQKKNLGGPEGWCEDNIKMTLI